MAKVDTEAKFHAHQGRWIGFCQTQSDVSTGSVQADVFQSLVADGGNAPFALAVPASAETGNGRTLEHLGNREISATHENLAMPGRRQNTIQSVREIRRVIAGSL